MDQSLWQTLSTFDLKHHLTCEFKQYCHAGSTAQQCRLGLFQDSDFAGDPEGSKLTSSGLLCIFGSHTFVPISWMCKKQTSVSHSSTEAELISLDVGLRMDGILALDLWDTVRSWRLKIDLKENFVHIWKSHVCSHKLDVQETNFSFTQVRRNQR